METIEAIKVYHKGPTAKITEKMKIPARTLVVLEGKTKLKRYHQHKFYDKSRFNNRKRVPTLDNVSNFTLG